MWKGRLDGLVSKNGIVIFVFNFLCIFKDIFRSQTSH